MYGSDLSDSGSDLDWPEPSGEMECTFWSYGLGESWACYDTGNYDDMGDCLVMDVSLGPMSYGGDPCD